MKDKLLKDSLFWNGIDKCNPMFEFYEKADINIPDKYKKNRIILKRLEIKLSRFEDLIKYMLESGKIDEESYKIIVERLVGIKDYKYALDLNMINNDKEMKEKLFEVVVGNDKAKIICRQINGLFQDIKTYCVYGSSVISYREIK